MQVPSPGCHSAGQTQAGLLRGWLASPADITQDGIGGFRVFPAPQQSTQLVVFTGAATRGTRRTQTWTRSRGNEKSRYAQRSSFFFLPVWLESRLIKAYKEQEASGKRQTLPLMNFD